MPVKIQGTQFHLKFRLATDDFDHEKVPDSTWASCLLFADSGSPTGWELWSALKGKHPHMAASGPREEDGVARNNPLTPGRQHMAGLQSQAAQICCSEACASVSPSSPNEADVMRSKLIFMYPSEQSLTRVPPKHLL